MKPVAWTCSQDQGGLLKVALSHRSLSFDCKGNQQLEVVSYICEDKSNVGTKLLGCILDLYLESLCLVLCLDFC